MSQPPAVPSHSSFIISNILTKDVGHEISGLGKRLGGAIETRLKAARLPTRIKTIFIRPILMNPAIAPPFENYAIHRRDGEIQIGYRIPFDAFVAATWPEKIALYGETLANSLSMIHKTRLAPEERDRIAAIIGDATEEQIRLALH